MFEKLLVPLDGSPLAERAIPYALALAEGRSSQVTLVRSAIAHTIPGVDPTDAQVRVIAEAQAYLDDVARTFRERGIDVETGVPYGEAADGIVDEIAIRNAGAVVMATHGRSGLGRWVYGSVAESVLHRSNVPVLLVRAWQSSGRADSILKNTRVVLPLDGSAFAEAALPVAASVARSGHARLVLAQVVTTPEHGLAVEGLALPYDVDAWKDEARGYLANVADRVVVDYGIERPEIEVRVGDPGDCLVELIPETRASLVVMATHGRTGLGRVLLGSVAGSVLRQCSVPLFLVHPDTGQTSTGERTESARELVEAGSGSG